MKINHFIVMVGIILVLVVYVEIDLLMAYMMGV